MKVELLVCSQKLGVLLSGSASIIKDLQWLEGY